MLKREKYEENFQKARKSLNCVGLYRIVRPQTDGSENKFLYDNTTMTRSGKGKNMEYAKIAETLVELSGGAGNISSVTHCSTRLRLFIRNKSSVNLEQIKKTKPVLGTVFSGDELQIVLGKNLIPIYNEVSTLHNNAGGSAPAVAEDKGPMTFKERIKDLGTRLIGFVSAAVTPLIPGLVAGGMLKVFLLLITLAWPAFEEMQTYTLLSMVANIPFYFMPIFVAYGAARKLGSTPLYAMTVAACLVYPNFVELLKGEDPVTILNIPVMVVTYSSTLLPALLIGVCAHYVEKMLTKIIPGIIRPVFVGMCTIAITFVLGITILGPLGDMAGSYVVNIFLWANDHMGPLAVGLLAGCMPLLVMTGMHHAVTPFMVQAIADPGYDIMFRPAYLLHNMAEGGACLGVALRAKNKAFKSQCFGLAFGCVVAGVTEPAIYGVNLRLKRPLIGVICGAAAGGVVARLMGATAYVYGYSTILALPIFQDTILAMLIGVIVAIAVAAVVTFLLGFDESIVVDEEEEATAALPVSGTAAAAPKGPFEVYAPVVGTVLPREQIPDETFATGVLGDGVGIEPETGVVVAPFDGEISSTTDTFHAVGISGPGGMELLIHVGVDTVSMQVEGFQLLVKEGDNVKKGQRLITFDIAKIKAAGHPATTAVLVTNSDDYAALTVNARGRVSAGDQLITVE